MPRVLLLMIINPEKTGHLSEVNAIISVIALGSGERLAVTIQRSWEGEAGPTLPSSEAKSFNFKLADWK